MHSHHLRRDLHRFLLHPDGPEVHLAYDRDGHPHLHRHRLLLAAPVVHVCRCGRLRHREERTGRPADDLDAVLAVPGGDRPADRRADAVLSDQEIINI